MTERERIEHAIQIQESLRTKLGDTVVDVTISALRQKLTALAKPPTDQRKQITILFGDLSGFTSMSEFMDAEELKDLMHELWQRIDAIIVQHGGAIDKHIGDAVMALWSATSTHEDDPEYAVRAALAIQAALGEFIEHDFGNSFSIGDRQRNREICPRPQMRIGINTGSVILGEIGSIGEITAMGDEVNLASRLEHAAPVGGILISHSTYRHVRDLFEISVLEPIKVKGKTDPVRVYEVLKAKPRTFRLVDRRIGGIETRMIGRKAELERIMDVLKTVTDDEQLQVVTVIGEAGIGKSRLLFEFNELLLPGQVTVFNARASEGKTRLPYSLIRDMFSLRFDIQDSDSSALAREKLENGIGAFFGQEGDPIKCAHFIGHLIGFDLSESPHLDSIANDYKQIRAQAFFQTAQFFKMVARHNPAVIYLEDSHWADDGSLDLLDYLLRNCSSTPLLILCLARPELLSRRPSLGEGQLAYVRFKLQPLSKRESRSLVKEILRNVVTLPQALQELIVSCAEGNPFYIQELIKLLVEQKVIVSGSEIWKVDGNKLSQISVPPSLRGILQARLDQLTPQERTVLQFAAVIGRVFWASAIDQLAVNVTEAYKYETAARSSDILDALRRKEFIYRRETSTFEGTDEYMFRHALLRDATYDAVLRRERPAYHKEVAAWLIEQSADRADEHGGNIAEHFELAYESAEAALWYGRAGDQARNTYLPNSATHYYRKALEQSELSSATLQNVISQAKQAQWYEGLGYSLMWQAQFAEAANSYNTMRLAAEAAGDAMVQVRAWNFLANAQEELSDYGAMLDSATRAERLAQEISLTRMTDGELARALNLQGWAYRHLGDIPSVVRMAERSLALAANSREGTPKQRAHSLQLLASVHTLLGDFERAYSYAHQALVIKKALSDRRGVNIMLNQLGEIDRSRGDFTSALSRYKESLAVAHEIGDLAYEIIYLSNIGGTYLGLREYDTAESYLRRALAMAPAGHFIFSETFYFLAEACLKLGKCDLAADAARRALDLGQQCKNLEFIGNAWRILGTLASSISANIDIDGKEYSAEECLSNSLNILTELSAHPQRARTLREWAFVARDGGDKLVSDTKWQEALAIYNRLDMKTELQAMMETTLEVTD